jgi:hypothetical protein
MKRVRITSGYYTGQTGRIIGTHQHETNDTTVYLVQLDNTNIRATPLHCTEYDVTPDDCMPLTNGYCTTHRTHHQRPL